MKIRSGFVSNSSSSSFICEIGNIKDAGCVIDIFDDMIHDLEDCPEEQKEYIERYNYYKELSNKNNSYIFDIDIDYDSFETIKNLKRKIPNFKILEEID